MNDVYVERMKAAMRALGFAESELDNTHDICISGRYIHVNAHAGMQQRRYIFTGKRPLRVNVQPEDETSSKVYGCSTPESTNA